jgi:hypothetical protein
MGGKFGYDGRMTNDQILDRIARFHFPKGPVIAERRNRGYSLFHANTGAPIARLRPFGPDDRVELLYWSSWKEKWAPTGPFGRTVLPLEQALGVIAKEGIFWTRARF